MPAAFNSRPRFSRFTLSGRAVVGAEWGAIIAIFYEQLIRISPTLGPRNCIRRRQLPKLNGPEAGLAGTGPRCLISSPRLGLSALLGGSRSLVAKAGKNI